MIPEKLYGRELEKKALLDAFDRVLRNGGKELVLVSGGAGVGKSSLVSLLHKAIVFSEGRFISGQFDQSKRDVPYAPVAQALQTTGGRSASIQLHSPN